MKWIATATLILLSTFSHAADLLIHIDGRQAQTVSLSQLTNEVDQDNITTHLPWLTDSHTFTGTSASELLDYLGVRDAYAMSFIGLNEYAATTTIEEIDKYHPIIAYYQDGKPMKVRHKGPYWLLFNVDKYPETGSEVFQTKMVWQIKEIIVHRKYEK
ncbi:molybdopterin-dependent oxidoreductase [Vibrio proteolyticus]|uniref:Oxidoreductase molybdopterin-binding domain-containing protein n=2 Tax=Vibrio TaxID=662 RepID=U3A3H9_VIBPR|nr:molybdopterin-dependent oxidoreductase [Vibrio proteolyticus]GAD68250.1 hypothetical protein VPR01S_12_00590 [Vibrio proteolyticus NBRC 13287]